MSLFLSLFKNMYLILLLLLWLNKTHIFWGLCVRYILPLIFVRFLFFIFIFANRLYYNIISCVYKILCIGPGRISVWRWLVITISLIIKSSNAPRIHYLYIIFRAEDIVLLQPKKSTTHASFLWLSLTRNNKYYK